MAKQFRFPDIGEGITEGEIVRWLKTEGDDVKEDETLAEVETDKAVVEIPSPYAGTVLKRHFREKDIIKVGEILVTIGAKGEKPSAPGEPAAAPAPAAAPVPEEMGASVVGEIRSDSREIREILATPRVRRLAREQGVDLSGLTGSGSQGRITEQDVRGAGKPPAPAGIKIKSKFDFYGTLERIAVRGVRRATARKMRESVSSAAHVTHFDEADVSALEILRKSLGPEARKRKVKLTALPFIVRAVISALQAHPLLNSILDEDEQEIVVKKYYNIGIAVDVPDGLIVPVIKFADQKSVFDLAGEIENLARGARERKLDLADLKGGTFSITNVGMLGGEYATPIINYPETAILATMRIADRVRAVDGEVRIVKTLPLCLSFDHRVIDGAEAARFTNDLIQALEDPQTLMASAPGS